MGPSVMFSEQQRQRRQQQKRREQRQNESRHEDDEDKALCRVRVYKFGDHVKRGPHGVLTLVPNSASMDTNIVKGMLMRSVYGDDIAFERVDWTTVQVFLLPDGEEIPSPGESGRRARPPRRELMQRPQALHRPEQH